MQLIFHRLYWLVVLLLVLGGDLSRVRATQSLTVSSPLSNVYAGETARLRVTGDKLTQLQLRLFRLQGTASVAKKDGARVLISTQKFNSKTPRSTWILSFRVPSVGWYQAEVSGGSATAFDEITFAAGKRPVPGKPVPSLEFSAPDELNPPGNASFGATGTLVKSATLRVWKLVPGGTQTKITEQSKPLPPRPKKKTDYYDPTIRFSVALKAPGVYLAEATSNTGLKRLKYIRVSDIGVVSKRAPHELLVYAVRLSTGMPLPNAAVRVDDTGVTQN